MVKYNNNSLDSVFSSLSDPTRRDILLRLAKNTHSPLNVTEIAKPYLKNMSLPAISKHIKVLEKAQLVIRVKSGREYSLRLDPKPLKTIAEYISFYKIFWNHQLDSLEKYLSKGGETKK